MTPEQAYWLSLGLIVVGSVAFGFVLGRPYWFAKGKLDGIDTCSDIWREALDLEDDTDEDDRILEDDGHFFWCSPECPDKDCEICQQEAA